MVSRLGLHLSGGQYQYIASPITAFGDLRNAELSPLFQGIFEYTVDNTDLNINTIESGGSVTQASGMAVLSTSEMMNGNALLRSRQYARYKPGLGGLIRFTALFSLGIEGTEQYIGIMDEPGSSAAFKNGYAIGYNGNELSFLRWRNDILVDDIPSSKWDDPLDGFGRSGVKLIPTNLNVFAINYQYLGAGNVFLYMENPNTGMYAPIYMLKYSNRNLEPSVYNPNFRFTMWVNNKTAESNITLKCASYGYYVEGKTNFIELHQPLNSTGTKVNASVHTEEIALFTIRVKDIYFSKTNFISALLHKITASIEASAANNLGEIRLVKNATLGGSPSYTDINATNSVVEIDTAGTTVSGGAEISSTPLAGKNDKIVENLTPYRIILGPGETLTFAGSSENVAKIKGYALWRELF